MCYPLPTANWNTDPHFYASNPWLRDALGSLILPRGLASLDDGLMLARPTCVCCIHQHSSFWNFSAADWKIDQAERIRSFDICGHFRAGFMINDDYQLAFQTISPIRLATKRSIILAQTVCIQATLLIQGWRLNTYSYMWNEIFTACNHAS